MSKVIGIDAAICHINDGDTIMVGGFMGNGSPVRLLDALEQSGKKNLTLICNDTAYTDRAVGKLVVKKQFRKIIATHIGLNKETGRQMSQGETEVVLVPQGTLVEQIRAAGYGLGGVLTRTGLGTLVQEGKEIITVDGVEYLLEKPIFADVALLYAHTADALGNLCYKGSENNFNAVMAAAAKITIAEAGHLVDTGAIDPNHVATPGVFVDYLVV